MKLSAKSAMKVSVVAQVMSRAVAAAINTLVKVGKDNCTVCFNHM
jgi:hypothetical protein